MIPIAQPYLSKLERGNLIDAFDSGWISSTGKYVEDFENQWAEATDSDYALSVANGTVALHIILAALKIGPGDSVIVPSMTFIATANAVSYVGATPIFADCDKDSWNITAEEIEKQYSTNVKAVIIVHLYGTPCDMESIVKKCNDLNIHLIEDAAEAPFATYKNRKIGSFGIAASFSFYGNKIITSGEGGAISTSDEELYKSIKLLRGQGMDPKRRYYFPVIGYNYRLTNLQCALLCGQLGNLPEILTKREHIFHKYFEYLDGIEGLKFQQTPINATTSPWLFTLALEGKTHSERDQIIKDLASRGVETRPTFYPIHLLPPYHDDNRGKLVITETLAAEGISLPTFCELSDKEIRYVSDQLIGVL